MRYWLISHDQKSCDIYKKFKWYKQTSTTPELQPHYSMGSLSVDKLNIVIYRLNSGQTTCQISSSTGVSIGTISKISSKHFPDLPKSSGGHPVKLSPKSSLLPLGRLKQQYKCPKHSKLSPTNLSLHRQCADTSGALG